MPTIRRTTLAVAAAAVGSLALASCVASPTATPANTPDAPGQTPAATSQAPASNGKLTVVTHDSFNLGEELIAKFEADSGLDVTFVAPGDAGTVTNQLVLTKDSPLGDVVFVDLPSVGSSVTSPSG